MSLTLKGNFKRGWPNPHIVEKVSQPDASCAAGSATPLYGFMGGRIDPVNGKWKLGITDAGQQPFIFRNGVEEADSGRQAHIASDYVQAQYGGIQGISFDNAILVETIQFVGTPAVDTEIFCDTDGKWKAGISGKVIVARVDEAMHAYQGQSYLTIRPVGQPYVKA